MCCHFMVGMCCHFMAGFGLVVGAHLVYPLYLIWFGQATIYVPSFVIDRGRFVQKLY